MINDTVFRILISWFQDGYQLALELDKATKKSIESGSAIDVVSSLRRQGSIIMYSHTLVFHYL